MTGDLRDEVAGAIRHGWHEVGMYARADLDPRWLDGLAAITADALMPRLERREAEARAAERERIARAIDAEMWQYRRVTRAEAGDIVCRTYDDAARIARTTYRADSIAPEVTE